jgi:hypothetical protein
MVDERSCAEIRFMYEPHIAFICRAAVIVEETWLGVFN